MEKMKVQLTTLSDNTNLNRTAVELIWKHFKSTTNVLLWKHPYTNRVE